MVLRDSKGKVTFSAFLYLFHCKDALETEITAIVKGLSLSIHRSNLSLMIQANSSVATAVLTDDSLARSAYECLMTEIKKLLQTCGFVPLRLDAIKIELLIL